jgi:hypothetical protein
MTVKYEFLTKDEFAIRGEIRGVPEFDPCTKRGAARLQRLIETWTGRKMHETLSLETYNEAAEAVRERMTNRDHP